MNRRTTLILIVSLSLIGVSSSLRRAATVRRSTSRRRRAHRSTNWSYLLPRGWQAIDRPTMCAVSSPDRSMGAMRILCPFVPGKLTAEDFFRYQLVNDAHFTDVRFEKSDPKDPCGYSDAGTFGVRYRALGHEYMAIANVHVIQRDGQTAGLIEMLHGRTELFEDNCTALGELLDSIRSTTR